jgi:hypothetical protein
MGTSQNQLRGQISRLWRICVNQRFTLGKCKGSAPLRELCPLATVFRRSQIKKSIFGGVFHTKKPRNARQY